MCNKTEMTEERHVTACQSAEIQEKVRNKCACLQCGGSFVFLSSAALLVLKASKPETWKRYKALTGPKLASRKSLTWGSLLNLLL